MLPDDPLLWTVGGAVWLAAVCALRPLLARHSPGPPPALDLAGDLLFGGLVWIAVSHGLVPGLVSAAARGRYELFFANNAAIAAVGSLVLLVTRRLLGGRPRLGLRAPGIPVAAGLGLAAYVTALPLVLFVHALSRRHLADDPARIQPSMQAFLDAVRDEEVFVAGAMTLILALVVPLFEELLFRGWLQSGLRAALGTVAEDRGAAALAILLASAVFTAVHPPYTWLPVLLLSLILGALYERTGTLWTSVVFHGAHNMLTLWYPVFTAP